MLSRTADNLDWIARYMERAETAARLLEVGARISLLPSASGYRSDWDSLLRASGNAIGYAAKYGAPAQAQMRPRFWKRLWRSSMTTRNRPG